MHIKLKITATVFLLAVAGLRPVSAGEKGAPKDAPPASAKASAAERGLAFLVQDALKWQKERKCASCHHGTMTVWVLSEAKSRGYATDTLTDMVKWNKERLQDIDKARDKRAGWSMVNTPAVFLSTMAQAIPAQDAVSAEELKKIAGHLVQHQESDGSWAWSLAPAKNRPPPVFESDEVVTLMAYMALGPHASAKSTEKSDAALAREKAAAWLAKIKPSETSTQANALRLLRDVRAGKSPKQVEAGINNLFALQNKDGGWGQDKGLKSDAFATGQALYYLSEAGVKKEREQIQRGVAFLVGNQKKDGCWPMTSRSHPGAKPFTNPVPITYFGSAWATMGLMRSLPKAKD